MLTVGHTTGIILYLLLSSLFANNGIPGCIHTLRHMLLIMGNVWHIATSKASLFVAEIVRIPRGYATL